MRATSETLMEKFDAASAAEYQTLREEAGRRGYPYFSDFLEALRDRLKRAEEADLPELRRLLGKARQLFPEPGAYSPSWVHIWEHMDGVLEGKAEAMNRVSPADRDGEWQIMMDNPYTNEPVSCYPALSFLEAAYLYGYFKPDLKKNEYIRLQKIVSLLQYAGQAE